MSVPEVTLETLRLAIFDPSPNRNWALTSTKEVVPVNVAVPLLVKVVTVSVFWINTFPILAPFPELAFTTMFTGVLMTVPPPLHPLVILSLHPPMVI